MRIRALVAFSVLVFLVGTRPAVAGGGGFGACAGFSRGSSLVMRDACFQGTAHIAETGTTVTVTNEGQAAHNITAVDGSFASGLLEPGESFTLRVDKPGTVPFYCTLHGSMSGSGMAGVLVVEAPASRTSEARAAALTSTDRDGSSGATGRDLASAPVVRATVDDSVPAYLAAGALLVSSIALAVAIAFARPARRSPQVAAD